MAAAPLAPLVPRAAAVRAAAVRRRCAQALQQALQLPRVDQEVRGRGVPAAAPLRRHKLAERQQLVQRRVLRCSGSTFQEPKAK